MGRTFSQLRLQNLREIQNASETVTVPRVQALQCRWRGKSENPSSSPTLEIRKAVIRLRHSSKRLQATSGHPVACACIPIDIPRKRRIITVLENRVSVFAPDHTHAITAEPGNGQFTRKIRFFVLTTIRSIPYRCLQDNANKAHRIRDEYTRSNFLSNDFSPQFVHLPLISPTGFIRACM